MVTFVTPNNAGSIKSQYFAHYTFFPAQQPHLVAGQAKGSQSTVHQHEHNFANFQRI